MPRKIEVSLSESGIQTLQRELDDYEKWLEEKTGELAKRLADLGAVKASLGFARAIYNGKEDHDITVEPQGENCYVVKAVGRTVLFVEFGAGIKYGYGHPELHGMGPGTYPPTDPDNPHWDDPDGWWYAHNQHTFGNPPNAPMYNAVKELEQELARVVKEVFAE